MRASAPLGFAALGPLAVAFVKIGFVFFGGGFLLVPVIHHEIVASLHWLTQREFVDGVAISQLTPGPVAVLATFCGFKQAGALGAVVATIAVMLPAFVLMLALSHGYSRFGELRAVRSVLNGLIPAIVGLLLASAVQIGEEAVRGGVGVALLAGSLVLMIRWRVNPAYLIAFSACVGMVLRL